LIYYGLHHIIYTIINKLYDLYEIIFIGLLPIWDMDQMLHMLAIGLAVNMIRQEAM
jgi:hypothetical protein